MKILVAEDDEHILEGLLTIMQNEGYTAFAARNGKEALDLFIREQPDVVCLDIMMPLMNGYDVCKQIRKHHPTIPILFLSAKSEEIDRVLGLELGADDFISKPFGVREIIARIRAITRRYFASMRDDLGSRTFIFGDLRVMTAELRAYRGSTEIELSLRDIQILQLLKERKNQVVDRNVLLDRCWGIDCMPNSRTVDQHIAQLRKRIESNSKEPTLITTVHGVGYRYNE